MDAPDVWVAKDDETEIIRAREIAAVNLDYDGNVTARLAGGPLRHRSRSDNRDPRQDVQQPFQRTPPDRGRERSQFLP